MIEPLPSWDTEGSLATFHHGDFEQWVLGRKIQKARVDMLRYRSLIQRIKPELIVETGTRWGGSAGWFAEIARCHVISIDIDPQQLGWTAKNRDQADRGITYITGSSIEPRLVDLVAGAMAGKRTLVSLDSDHHAPHVLTEMAMYGMSMASGDVMVVEDGCFDLWLDEDARRGGRQIPEQGGPLQAIRTFMQTNGDEWERLTDVEGMYAVSHSPCGWWAKR